MIVHAPCTERRRRSDFHPRGSWKVVSTGCGEEVIEMVMKEFFHTWWRNPSPDCFQMQTSLGPGVDASVMMDTALHCSGEQTTAFSWLSVTVLKPRVCVLEQIIPPSEQGHFTEGFWGTLRYTRSTAGTWAAFCFLLPGHKRAHLLSFTVCFLICAILCPQVFFETVCDHGSISDPAPACWPWAVVCHAPCLSFPCP